MFGSSKVKAKVQNMTRSLTSVFKNRKKKILSLLGQQFNCCFQKHGTFPTFQLHVADEATN